MIYVIVGALIVIACLVYWSKRNSDFHTQNHPEKVFLAVVRQSAQRFRTLSQETTPDRVRIADFARARFTGPPGQKTPQDIVRTDHSVFRLMLRSRTVKVGEVIHINAQLVSVRPETLEFNWRYNVPDAATYGHRWEVRAGFLRLDPPTAEDEFSRSHSPSNTDWRFYLVSDDFKPGDWVSLPFRVSKSRSIENIGESEQQVLLELAVGFEEFLPYDTKEDTKDMSAYSDYSVNGMWLFTAERLPSED